MKKSPKIEEVRADDNEAEQLKELLDSVNESQPLPASRTELILLEVDPHRAHAYWNIDAAEADPSLPLVLRVYDITESGSPASAAQAFDVEVQGNQGRWYLDLWRDDRTFVSEIGYRNPNGSLQVIATSNEVQTPRSEPVDAAANGGHTDLNGKPLHTEWPGDKVEGAAPPDAPGYPVPPENEEIAVLEPVTILDAEFPETDWNKTPPSEKLKTELAIEHADAAMAAGDAAVAFEDSLVDASIDPQWSGGADDSSEEPGQDFPSAEELTASIKENNAALQAFYASAGPEAVHADERSGDPSPNEGDGYPSGDAPPEGLAPLEQIVGLSSMENAGKDVLLEVNAELHIYGRSKPNTELTLYGQVVKTRPDGTFSVRRILPHGAVILPLLYKKDT